MVENPVSGGLAGKSCQAWMDPSDIPHLRGSEEGITFACLGYVHGRDRAWQMDFLRRTAQGRKAEVLGSSAIRGDVLMRLLGFEKLAERIFAEMPANDQSRLWAYTHGVNQAFPHTQEDANRSYEFAKWHYRPEPWRPQDTVLIILLQAFDQTRKTFEQDIAESKPGPAPVDVGADLPWMTSVLKSGEYETRAKSAKAPGSSSDTSPAEAAGVEESSEHEVAWGFGAPTAGVGSNNWVLAPTRTRSGKAWLANDPHLSLKHPSFWYWVHLQTDGATTEAGGAEGNDVMGATLPGMPMIIAGANRKVAWGLTNSYMDVADARVIRAEELGELQSFRPVIWFKWGFLQLPFFFKSLERTSQGWPILPLDLPAGSPAGAHWVMRWSGFDLKGDELSGFSRLMDVQSVAEADALLAKVGIPSWNYVFADTRGRIGYRVVGKVPARAPGGLLDPAPGRVQSSVQGLTDWRYLTADEMPHVLDPARGYVVTANNAQWPGDAKFAAGRAFSPSFRAFRIEELLQKVPKHDLESQRHIQCDEEAEDARFLLPLMLKSLEQSARPEVAQPLVHEAVAMLRVWDRRVGMECRACGIFRAWVQEWLWRTDRSEEIDLYRALATQSTAAPVVEARKLAQRELGPSLMAAIGALKRRERGSFPTWGEIHKISFAHFSGDENFRKDPLPSPGDTYTVSPGTMTWDRQTAEGVQTAGPSQRLLIELSDPPQIYAQVAGSQGDIEKPKLNDPTGPWMKWNRCEVEKRLFPLDWSRVSAVKISL